MATLKYGIVGWPASYSVSPAMQEAAFVQLGIDATYERLPVEAEALTSRIPALVASGYAGWNVTVPHKQTIIGCIETLDPSAAVAGSVNTVVNRGGSLTGFSTDGYGLEQAIAEAFGAAVVGGTFLFWGTGGAARAAAVHFALHGAARLYFVNRTRSRAEQLAADLAAAVPGVCTIVVDRSADGAIAEAIQQSNVIIQCTSMGLSMDDAVSIPLSYLDCQPDVYDMIYLPTRLITEAAARGCRVADGRGMLLHQGARAFEIWTGQPAPISCMRAALDRELATSARK